MKVDGLGVKCVSISTVNNGLEGDFEEGALSAASEDFAF